ncbi:MAG: hypothetical protein ACP5E8_05045 [Thermoplasmata archaeon]
MNLYPGIITFVISIVLFYLLRYMMNRRVILSSKIIERNLRVTNMEGCFTGSLVYLITIIVLVIGPISYDIFKVTQLEYIILNFVAGLVFVYLYSPFAPITGLATMTIYERSGTQYCMVGEILGRKYKVISISRENGIEVTFKRGRGECRLSSSTPRHD